MFHEPDHTDPERRLNVPVFIDKEEQTIEMEVSNDSVAPIDERLVT
jgi:hypothetical protein